MTGSIKKPNLAFITSIMVFLLIVLVSSTHAWGAGKGEFNGRKEKRVETPEQADPKVIKLRVTAYCMPAKNKPRGVNGPDETSTGAPLRIGVAAADPKRLPFGTKISIPGFGKVTVLDTMGKSVTRKWKPGKAFDLDIFIGRGSKAEKLAQKWGVQHLEASVILPTKTEPKDYILAQE